jgi:hypothetical protein
MSMSFTFIHFEIRGKKNLQSFFLLISECNIISKHPQKTLTLFNDRLLKSIQIVENGK